MGNSLREVKIRINSTKSIAQITNAMCMVSQSKVKKAEKTYLGYRDFMSRIGDVVTSIVDSKGDDITHPMLVERPVNKTAYLLITSDRGLAGAYNSNVYKEFKKIIEENHKSNDEFITGAIGKQGYGFLKKNGYKLLTDEPVFVKDDVLFVDLVDFADKFIDSYIKQDIDKLVIVYNHYVNTISQEIKTQTILPLGSIEGTKNNIEYVFETSIEKTLDIVLPLYVQDIIYGIILDAKTAEHCARMNSMRIATDNADDVIGKLQLLYNRARQESITNELIDVIGGANAIGGGK